MQGLGWFFSPSVYVCVKEKKRDWFRQQDHFSIFLFLEKFKPQKNTHFQRVPLSKANCCFSISSHLLLICPLRKSLLACLLEEGSSWGGWGWSWKSEMLPWACVMMVWASDLMHGIELKGRCKSTCSQPWAHWEFPRWAGSALLSKWGVFQKPLLLDSWVHHYRKAG